MTQLDLATAMTALAQATASLRGYVSRQRRDASAVNGAGLIYTPRPCIIQPTCCAPNPT
jgi:hypothetical protein